MRETAPWERNWSFFRRNNNKNRQEKFELIQHGACESKANAWTFPAFELILFELIRCLLTNRRKVLGWHMTNALTSPAFELVWFELVRLGLLEEFENCYWCWGRSPAILPRTFWFSAFVSVCSKFDSTGKAAIRWHLFPSTPFIC